MSPPLKAGLKEKILCDMIVKQLHSKFISSNSKGTSVEAAVSVVRSRDVAGTRERSSGALPNCLLFVSVY